MKITFACNNCRLIEAKRCKALDDKANKGKIFHKIRTEMNPDNFINEASEMLMLKNTQLDYGLITDDTEITASVNDGWKFCCSKCNTHTVFSRGFDNL